MDSVLAKETLAGGEGSIVGRDDGFRGVFACEPGTC